MRENEVKRGEEKPAGEEKGDFGTRKSGWSGGC